MNRLCRFRGLAVVATFAAVASARAATVSSLPDQGTSAASPHNSVAVIVNRENAVNELSVADLRRILLGDMTRWPGGRKITIAMREPGQPERDALLKLVCRMSEQEFVRYTLQAAYRGEPQSVVKQLDTPNGLRRFVFNVPGAIGFVRGDEVDDSIKVLAISGIPQPTAAFGLTLRAR